MSIASFQTGTISLALGDSSVSDTLATTVTQSNSILIVSVSGGNNTPSGSGVKVSLNSAGTTVTADRSGSGANVEVAYQVIESTAFNVQHFDQSVTSTSQNITLSSVDTDYSFAICTGVQSGGSTRGSDDVCALEITTATNLLIEAQASSGSRQMAFQVIEMSSSEIASVQFHQVSQASTQVDTTITSVDTTKSLIFASCRYNTGGTFASDKMPALSLTSATNLRADSYGSTGSLLTWVYVVEFVNMTATHAQGTISTATTTELLGSTPTYGGAVISGIYGRYSSANDTDDDTQDNMWNAKLSGSTWTFTRAAAAVDANLAYSVFDWDDLFAGGGGAFTLTADSGSYSYTGTDSSITLSALLEADSGNYAYSGSSVDLNRGFVLSADSGGYVYTGTDAGLIFAGAGNFTLVADSGAYVYTGTDAAILKASSLQADSGSYTYSGTIAALSRGFTLSANAGSYSYNGTEAGLSRTRVLQAESGAYSYTGFDAALNYSAGFTLANRREQIYFPSEDREISFSSVDRTINL